MKATSATRADAEQLRTAARWAGLVLACTVGCRGPSDAPGGAGAPDPTAAAVCDDVPDAAPACGSEWCAEHGVAEADCTQCRADASTRAPAKE
jgi:hypothetical protein